VGTRAYALEQGFLGRLRLKLEGWREWAFPWDIPGRSRWKSGGQLGPIEPFDPAKVLADNRVLFVYDSHHAVELQRAFKELLPPLARAGITDVVLETFPHGEDLRDLRAAFKLIPANFTALRLLDIIDQAHTLGLRVWGINRPFAELRAELDEYGVPRDLAASAAKSNRVWSEHLLAWLRAHPDAKLVVHVGGAHVGYYDAWLLNMILAANGFPSAVLYLHSEDDRFEFPEKQWMRPLVQTNPDPFMVRESGWPRWFDYLASTGRTRPPPSPAVARVLELQARSRELWGPLEPTVREAEQLMARRNPDPREVGRLLIELRALQGQLDTVRRELKQALRQPSPVP
jgi:hypothetical protein